MKTFHQFILESNSKITKPQLPDNNNLLAQRAGAGRIGGFIRNVVDPRTGPISNAATSVVRDVVAPRLPKQIQPTVRTLAPIVGTAVGMTRFAPHTSAIIAGIDAGGTASGKVKTGTYKGNPVYMAK